MGTPADHRPQSQPVTLASLRKGEQGVVHQVLQRDPEAFGDEVRASIGRRLVEIGFVPGESVQVVGEVWPGGDPIAVRVGNMTVASRPMVPGQGADG